MLTVFTWFMIVLFAVMFVLAIWKGKQFLQLPVKYRLGIALPFAALMLIWIVALNLEADKHEPTVFHLCWDAQGRAIYPKRMEVVSPACSNPEPFSWPKKTKTVYLDLGSTTLYDEYKSSFREAIDLWNGQLDMPVFEAVDTMSNADIVISFGPVGGSEAATTRHVRSADGALSAKIEIVRPSDIRNTYIHMAHELGHAGFGLAHDTAGIMHPSAGEVNSMRVWLITEPDKRAIRQMLK